MRRSLLNSAINFGETKFWLRIEVYSNSVSEKISNDEHSKSK